MVSVALACAALWWTGAAYPRLSYGETWPALGAASPRDDFLRPTSLAVEQEWVVVNDGWAPVRITGFHTDIAGLELAATSPATRTIGARQSATFVLRFTVTDCDAVPFEPQPVTVLFDHWLFDGSYTGQLDQAWAREVRGERYGLAWQRADAEQACGDALDLPF